MTALTYQSSVRIDATNGDEVGRFAESMRLAVMDPDIEMRTTQLSFDGNVITARFRASINTTVETASADRDTLANRLVEAGVEPDKQSATDNISL